MFRKSVEIKTQFHLIFDVVIQLNDTDFILAPTVFDKLRNFKII
jgi:hypothetical protein